LNSLFHFLPPFTMAIGTLMHVLFS